MVGLRRDRVGQSKNDFIEFEVIMFYEGDNDSGRDKISSYPQTSSRHTSEMKSQQKLSCPICDKSFDRATTTAMPFCSPRCKQIDLGRWLTEQYTMPHEGNDAAEGFGPRDDDEQEN